MAECVEANQLSHQLILAQAPDQLIFCTDCEPSSTSCGPREPTQCLETRCNKLLLKIRIHRQVFRGDKEHLMS